jgi:hypothetical protein
VFKDVHRCLRGSDGLKDVQGGYWIVGYGSRRLL